MNDDPRIEHFLAAAKDLATAVRTGKVDKRLMIEALAGVAVSAGLHARDVADVMWDILGQLRKKRGGPQ